MKTMLLDTGTWDLVLDVNGNIAAAAAPYQLAQDAASAIRTFQGEDWYNTTLGVPYFQSFLGRAPNAALIKQKFIGQALTVPGVVSARVFITSAAGRRVTGQIQVTDQNGDVTAAAF
jgi:hypothetical protein